MKTTISVFMFIAAMTFAGMAMATTWTVKDDADFWFNGGGSTYSKTLDLGTVGYISADTITSAQLLLDFYGIGSITKIVLNGLTDNTNHIIFSLGQAPASNFIVLNGVLFALDQKLTYAVTLNHGLLDLNLSGNGFLNGLELTDATLTANGSQQANGPAVPEPGTIMLLCAGFLGLAIYNRQRHHS